MRIHPYRATVGVLVGILALLAVSDPAHAQLGRIRAEYWDKFKGTYYDAISRWDSRTSRDEIVQVLGPWRDMIERGIYPGVERMGEQLHEKDRQWLGSRRSELTSKVHNLRNYLGQLEVQVKRVGESYDSQLRELKSAYKEFEDSYNEAWREHAVHYRELVSILEKFRRECPQCE